MAVNKVMYDNDTLIDTSNDTALEEYVMDGYTFHSYSGEKLTGNLNVYGMIADEYDSTATYAKDAYCIHDGKLYQCPSAISTAEAWNPSHWELVTVGEELEQAQSEVADVYTKSQIDSTLDNYYTKTQVDTTIADYYTKTQIDSTVATIQGNIADAYSSSSAYAVGDYCLKDGVLYQCNTTIGSGGEAWNSSHWDAVSMGTSLEQSIQSINGDIGDINTAMETKAEIDGYYEAMTVGNAEQIVSSVTIPDSVPYNFRTSGGSVDIGNREDETVVGGTVAWNQWAKEVSTSNYNQLRTTFSESGGKKVITITGAGALFYGATRNRVAVPAGHVGLVAIQNVDATNLSTSYKIGITLPTGGGSTTYELGTDINYKMFKLVGYNACGASVYFPNSVANDTFSFTSFQLFDLTQMFGSNLADYIYSLETANAGDGVAWFRKLFPKPYYSYDSGTLMSVQAASHGMVGFNQLDDNTVMTAIGFTKESDGSWYGVSGNAFIDKVLWENKCNYSGQVCISYKYKYSTTPSQGIRFRFVFSDGTYLDVFNTSTTSYTDKYATSTSGKVVSRIMLSYGSSNIGSWFKDICVNFSWDGERDGEYEPYELHSYALDTSLELRGIPKLDADNNLYYDGDVYESDGTVTRKYGIVDLGTLTWSYGTYVSTPYFNTTIPNIKPGSSAVSAMYMNVLGTTSLSSMPDKSLRVRTSVAAIDVINSAYTDAATFKTAMSGVYLVYELATPTTESATPYAKNQIVSDWGTEEYVDYGVEQNTRDVAIPVGHNTLYQSNLRAKLEMAPNSPSDGDGDYVVRQTDGLNEYVKLSSLSLISDMTGDIADIAEDVDDLTETTVTLQKTKAGVIISSASGEIVTVEDGANNMAIRSLEVNIEPLQAGSGDPSPTNVRPITGWTGVNVTRTGKNLMEISANSYATGSASIEYLSNGVRVYNSSAGTYRFGSWGTFALDKFRGETLTFSCDCAGTNKRVVARFYKSDGTSYGNTVFEVTTATINQQITVPTELPDGGYLRFSFYSSGSTSVSGDCSYTNIQLEVGSSVTAYQAYTATTLPITWQSIAGTVYGGSYDLVTGVLKSCPYYASYNGETLTGHWISDRDVYAPGTTPTTGAQVVNDGGVLTEHSLTSIQISTLLGLNNIWADCGSIANMEYPCDTKLYIELLTQPTEDDMVANANIASGKFFMVENRLFLSTASIAVGDTIHPGTGGNCTEVSLSDALNSLNS